MRKTLSYIALLFLLCSISAKPTFSVNGHITGYDGIYIHLQKNIPGTFNYQTVDSTLVQQGNFVFGNIATVAERYSISFPGKYEAGACYFILDNRITVQARDGNLNNALVLGSLLTEKQRAFNDKYVKHFSDAERFLGVQLLEYRRQNDTVAYRRVGEAQKAIGQLIIDNKVNYIKAHPESVLAFYLYSEIWSEIGYKSSIELFKQLEKKGRGHPVLKALKPNITAWEKVDVGTIAPAFAFRDDKGKVIRLSDFKGDKVVLLDIWGTWCGPCRAERPLLRKMNRLYGNKGLQVISIAHETITDNDFAAAKAEIAKLDMPWINILLNENDKANNMLDRYAGIGYPLLVLIDRSGRIAARFQGYSNSESNKEDKELPAAIEKALGK
jgi:thiol-disulfide isomerase/thioredoxin